MAKDFIKQWDGRRLEDWGSVVSKEFNQFQNAFKREVERLAQEGGARLVSYGKGHYDMYGFLEKDGTYVYFSYGALDRTKVQLTSASDFISPLLMRTAKHEKDYRGGSNNNILFTQFLPTMQRLFKQQQPSVVTTQPEPVKEVKPSVVTTKKPKKFNLYQFSKMPKYATNKTMNGVYHDSGYMIATDGMKLVALKAGYAPSLEGKVIDKKGKEIEGRFPNWKSVIPDYDIVPSEVFELTLQEKENLERNMEEGKKELKIPLTQIGQHYWWTEDILKTLEVLDKLETTTIRITPHSKTGGSFMMSAKSDKGTYLLMALEKKSLNLEDCMVYKMKASSFITPLVKQSLTTELTWLHYANLFFLFFNFNQAEAQQAA